MLPFTRELIVSTKKPAIAVRGLWLLLLIVAMAITLFSASPVPLRHADGQRSRTSRAPSLWAPRSP